MVAASIPLCSAASPPAVAAHSSFLRGVIGLLIGIPIIVFGSTPVLKWMERFPAIIYIGAGVLAATAVSMIAGEPFIKEYLAVNEAGMVALHALRMK